MQTHTQLQFASLITEHKGAVYQAIKKYCNDEYAEDDLFQEIAIKAWQTFHTFEGRSKFSTWLWGIARNTAVDRFRRLYPFKTVLLDNIFYQLSDSTYEETEPGFNASSIMDRLTATEKLTLQMRIDGLSYTQIAEQTGEPENRIRVRMHRLKSILAESIKKEINKTIQ
jgi:RNA polymerase sigma factor (sigma-70 family)